MFTHKAVRSIFVIFLVVAVAGICGISRAAEKPKEVRIGIITPTVLEEPWNTSFLQALERVQKAAPHGLKVKWDFTENVFNPDAERVLMEYAKTGKYDIIWSHSVYPKAVERLHNKFPDILWVMAGAGNKAYGGNTYWVEMNIQEPAYLMGMIAGKLTKTNTIGTVISYPYPNENMPANAFIDGAKSVNPKIKAKATYIDSWFDPPKAKEAALAQIAAGADQIYALSFGPFEACREKGIQAYGHYVDQQSMDPDTIVVSTMALWDPGVNFVINEWYQHKMGRKSFDGPMEPMIWFMNEGGADLAPLGAWEKKLPPALVKEVEAKRQAIKDGTFKVPFNANKVVSD